MRIAVLDIGGTSIKSGVWTGTGLEETREQATNAKNGGAYVMEKAVEIIDSYGRIDAIGISTAGQVNSREGYIRYANENIPGYTGMKVREIMEEKFGVPTAVENDVNAAAIGEGWQGAGRDQKDFLCVTYGTGVGGAIVIDRNIYSGSSFSAAEFGGILVHPGDKKPGDPFSGCYEKYASATALVKKASAYDPALENGRKIFARLEEEPVRNIVDGWIGEIVFGLHSLIHIFNPSCIILGGGVMAQPYVTDQVSKRVCDSVMSSFSHVMIRPAELGNHAGLIGAASLAVKKLEQPG